MASMQHGRAAGAAAGASTRKEAVAISPCLQARAADTRSHRPDVPVIIATGNPDEIDAAFRLRYNVFVVTEPYGANAIVRELPATVR
jgi:hypothetical protein